MLRIDGRWEGYYVRHGTPSGIIAEWRQEGERIVGEMRDLVTDREQTLEDVALDESLPPAGDEQMVALLRSAFPESPGEPIRVVSHLPERSTIEGEFYDDTIRFVKTYQGPHINAYRVGDQTLEQPIENHRVHFQGRLSADATTLEGRWWIEGDRSRGTPSAEGTFLLRREMACGRDPGDG